MAIAGNLLLASIPILISMYATRWKLKDEAIAFHDNPRNSNLPLKKSYDFIIVGAGAAGCVLANRLSKNYTILLIDAGGEPPPLIAVPQLQGQIADLPGINYLYRTKKQKNAALATGGVLTIPAGKMLGGSGSHNHLIYERGNPLDFDRWANLTQDKSWAYKNVLRIFKKIENYHGTYQNNSQHGHSGPEDLDESPFALGAKLWLAAGKELGYKIRDPNGPQRVGFSKLQSTRRNGRRASTYTAYLKPILKKRRKNLKVLKYSKVCRILFKGKTAIGVEYERHGVARAAFASKEVIISAGTFMTPIILFKSGIGPKDQVQAAKAEKQIAVLPVGQNLMDHHRVDIGPILVDDPRLTWSLDRNLTYKDVQNFIKSGQGPLASTTIQVEAYIKSGRKSVTGVPETTWPDLRIVYKPLHSDASHKVGGYVLLGRPLSRGVLTINESSVEDDTAPILDYKYYSVDSDMDVMIEGIQFFLKIMEQTTPFKKVGARLSHLPYGPCKNKAFRSTEYWKCYIRHTTSTSFHSCGTCRMGRSKDPEAVVDSKLRVIGLKRLRVVDASIIPFITNTNIYAPSILIGEKGALDILKAHAAHPSRRNKKIMGGKEKL